MAKTGVYLNELRVLHLPVNWDVLYLGYYGIPDAYDQPHSYISIADLAQYATTLLTENPDIDDVGLGRVPGCLRVLHGRRKYT